MDEFETSLNSIQEKLGEENSAAIADEIAKLMSYNTNIKQTIQTKDKSIQKLQSDKENLISVNGNLLQQVAMSEENILKPNKSQDKTPNTPFNFKAMLDEKGNFI